jgi:uncharacterized BrkB/YihY/UPF0761 family membrane protein
MNKKFWTGFIAVFVVMEILMYIIHGVILDSTYKSIQGVWRADMESLMWIYHVLGIIGAFFLTLACIAMVHLWCDRVRHLWHRARIGVWEAGYGDACFESLRFLRQGEHNASREGRVAVSGCV